MMSFLHSVIANSLSISPGAARILFRTIQWVGGLSISTIILLLILFITTIILRRKGYGIRLGFFCIIIYARPGSRRFPDGCEVRFTSRTVGFLFGGCRGPWLDISAERFYMRLRPTLVRPRLPRRWMSLLSFFWVGVAAVDLGYWSTFFRNLLTRIIAFWVRGLRIRVDKVRIWKDGGSWEYKAEQFVFSGHAVGVFGSKYSLSVNELFVNVCMLPESESHLYQPIQGRLVLQKGIEVIAYLTPRLLTIFRPRRLAIMDDLKFSFTVRDVSCTAPRVLDASITHIVVELCPGYSRSLRAKLPPSAPVTRHPRKPGLLRYWEGNGAIHGLSFRYNIPARPHHISEDVAIAKDSYPGKKPFTRLPIDPLQGSENGIFARLESLRIEAYGRAADERHEPMTHASISVRGCSAGSAVADSLSHSLYESSTIESLGEAAKEDSKSVESVENIDKIIAARPEALLWIEDVTAAVDVNCSNRHATRVDVAGNGGVIALEPVGLAILAKNMRQFISKYVLSTVRREHSASSLDSQSFSSLPRTASSGSLTSVDSDSTSLRIVSDMRHWTFAILGHGPVGQGDTLAIVASSDSIVIPQVDFAGTSHMRITGQVKNFVLMHWSQWARTTNVVCREGQFDINDGLENGKNLTLRKTSVEWDLDLQAGLLCLPKILMSLRELRRSRPIEETSFATNSGLPRVASRTVHDRGNLSELRHGEPQEENHVRLKRTLSDWHLSATDLSVSLPFPDGPVMELTIGNLPSTCFDADTFIGHHVVWRMQDMKVAYADELRLASPLHTMPSTGEKRSVSVDFRGLRIIMFYHMQFGYLLQDWLLRLRAAMKTGRDARMRKRGIDPETRRKHPFPDLFINAVDVEIHFEDHPLGGFFTSMLPLMQDEARERMAREELMDTHIQQLSKVTKAEFAGTAKRCKDALKEKDSSIWVDRVKCLKKASAGLNVAEGHLAPLQHPPGSSFTAATISFSIVMDDAVRQHGSKESLRILKMLDDYELGEKKYDKKRQHDRDAWNSIGFRHLSLEATSVELRFRNYNLAFLKIDRMCIDNATVGQAVQATLPPYVAETSVAIGRRRKVKIVKGLGPTKSFVDIHLTIETLQAGFNPSFLSAIAEFGRGVSRFFAGGKNPSPRIPWYDSLRVNMHGKMRLTAKKLKCHLTSSVSPYSTGKHFVDVRVDNFEMLTSRLEASDEDPFPISFKLYNCHIFPRSFDKKRRSEIIFETVRVGLIPRFTVLSDDPQDHYFIPFPSREEVISGGPGIGKGMYSLEPCEAVVKATDNGFGNYTVWRTGLHDIPGHDSFEGFKTRSMILGLDIMVQHAQADRLLHHGSAETAGRSYFSEALSPKGASVVHSDAISTITKVVKVIVNRPVSCRLGPKRMGPSRKPPSETGLSTSFKGLDICVNAKDLNLMLYNNLEPGHGLFFSIGYLNGELWKRTEISKSETDSIVRTSKLTRRRFNIVDVFSSIRVPGLDLAVDSDDMGKLLTVDKISLSDDPRDEVRYMASPSSKGINKGPSSGFGNEDLNESPFYTFSDVHPLQRGKVLDKVKYDKRLLVDRIRLIWSPVRRASVFAWPDAFKEKSFAMRAAKIKSQSASSPVDENSLENASKRGVNHENDKHMDKDSSARMLFSSTGLNVLGDQGEHIPNLKLTATKQNFCNPAPALSNVYLSRRASSSPVRSKGQEGVTPDAPILDGKVKEASRARLPLSPPMLSMSRPAANVIKRQGGSMVDLLAPHNGKSSEKRCENLGQDESSQCSDAVRGAIEVLKTRPKIALYINDCQVAFGSPETSGIVLLSSKAVRVGIVDKTMQKKKQLGRTNERWSDREFRFHLNEANLFTRSRVHGKFDFSARNWVPQERANLNQLSLVTVSPISMDLMYISSSGLPPENGAEEDDDYILRPSLLFINIPDINMSTNTDDFHAATDVVRKVLMQSMRYSELVNEELSQLRYNLQLLGGNPSSEALEEFMRRVSNVTRQFLYAGDTFQQNLVKSLYLPDSGTFHDNLLKYKAKAKAVATFTRQDHQASSKDALHPTMYVSYSFDRLSWELREKQKEGNPVTEVPFVEITLEDLVCRHIFYVGRGSSTEVTFGNISAQNKMRSGYFQGILQPAATGTNYGPGASSNRKTNRIKASDGTAVAFRWYSVQEDKVGGIPVYDSLTIQVAPMTAAVSRKLYNSVLDFIFSARSTGDNDEGGNASGMRINTSGMKPSSSWSGASNGSASSGRESRSSFVDGVNSRRSASPQEASGPMASTNEVRVSEMAQRGGSSILFKYVFIDTLELTASYKNKETQARGVLDFFDLFVTTPSYSYSSEVWTWKKFAGQVRKDLVTTFALRGVSNLAKIKLLPGYSRARRKLVKGAETFVESINSVLPSTNVLSDGEMSRVESGRADEDVKDVVGNGSVSSPSEEDDEVLQTAIDAAVADISSAEGMRREKVLKALYGSNGRIERARSGSSSGWRNSRRSNSVGGSISSTESGTRRRRQGLFKPPIAPGERKSTSTPSGGSVEQEAVPRGMFDRLRRRVQDLQHSQQQTP